MDIVLAIYFFILLGLTMLKGRYVKVGIGEIPLIYKSVVVQFILNISILLFFGLSIFLLFFYNWKFFLLLVLIGFVTEAFIIVPLLEKALYSLSKPFMENCKK